MPSPLQRAQERSIAYTLAADTVILVGIVAVAILTNSLTLMSEGLRIFIILVAGYWNLWCLIALNRDRLNRYQFGTDKFEYLAAVLCSLALMIGGIMVAEGVVGLLFAEREAASPAGLAVAAIVNAVNVLINVLGWIAMLQSSTDQASEAFRTQLRVRVTLLISSGVVQVTLTAAALAKDPLIALLLDATGASFVALLMLSRGLEMLRQSIPVMLDIAASPGIRSVIAETTRRSFPETVLHSIQTRRVGDGHVARVCLLANADLPVDRLRKCATALQAALSRIDTPLHISVSARTEEGIFGTRSSG